MTAPTRDIDVLLRLMVEHEASDLHLRAGSPPTLRVGGGIRELDSPPLEASHITNGWISKKVGMAVSPDPEQLERMLRGDRPDGPGPAAMRAV